MLLSDDEVAGVQLLSNGARRCFDVVDDRLEVRTERRADRHDDEVIVSHGAEVRRGTKPAGSHVVGHELVKPGLAHAGGAQVDLVDDVLPYVDPGDGPAAVGQHATDHRADVAEPDNCDTRLLATHQLVDLGVATSKHAFRHWTPPSPIARIRHYNTGKRAASRRSANAEQTSQ